MDGHGWTLIHGMDKFVNIFPQWRYEVFSSTKRFCLLIIRYSCLRFHWSSWLSLIQRHARMVCCPSLANLGLIPKCLVPPLKNMLHHASSCFIHNILSFLTIFHWWHLKIPGALFWVSLFSPFSLASPASRYLYCEYCNQSVFWWDPSCSWRHDMLCPRRTTTWELRWSETQQIKAIGRWVYILTMASVHQFLKLWAFRDPPILHQFLKLWAFRDPPIYTSLFQVNMIICTLW